MPPAPPGPESRPGEAAPVDLFIVGGGAGRGRRFGATLTEAETRWLVMREFARSAEDILWRRTKLGLRMTPDEVAELEGFLAELPEAVADGR